MSSLASSDRKRLASSQASGLNAIARHGLYYEHLQSLRTATATATVRLFAIMSNSLT